ncbi:hypothetical protein LI90_4335 (plasmid) [Carbonactinospora thermoautotrophica]|uniref:Capsid maturation protease n=1 Tax=Carbonactinospora thermoautotrophica TaxID=1469144 RepID=A0A132MHT4_9ACTN|nr:hypothetical protein [Carbonactinospora thermoautotrophica]KWW97363.1 hypothetical protein LI90_4335 [Carbonactinospora thermoautotrophica]
MCDLCGDTAALEARVLLAELEHAVRQAEIAAGWTVPWATRPLHEHEVAAQVRFAELDRLTREAAELIARHAGQVRNAVLDALAEDLARHATTPFAVVDRLRELADPTTGATLPGLRDAIEAAAEQIEAVLCDLYGKAAGELLEEAARQGVPASVLPATVTPTVTEQTALQTLARTVAQQPVARLLDIAHQAARTAAAPDADALDVLDAALTSAEEASTAGTADLARQAAGQAHGYGRTAAARRAPAPKQVYASELLDRNTCGPCAQVDGRTYATIDDALVDYPGGGGFRACEGGARCRGTLVFVWATESDPTRDVPGDGRSPGTAPPDLTPRGPITGAPAPNDGPLIDVPGFEPEPEDLAALTVAELEARLDAASAAQDWDAMERYADELDRRTGATWPEDERRVVDDDWTQPFDDPLSDEAAEATARHAADMDEQVDQMTDYVLDPIRGLVYVGKDAKPTPGKPRGRKLDRVKALWDEEVYRMHLEAEAATNGYLVRRDRLTEFTQMHGNNTQILFTGPASHAYYFASEELRRWWEEHPRITFAEFAVANGITNRTMVERARKAAEARKDAALRAEEDPEKRRQRQEERRRRRGNFTEPDAVDRPDPGA